MNEAVRVGGLDQLSPRLREVVERLVKETPTLVDATREAVTDDVPAYGRIADPSVIAEVNVVIRENARLWYRTLLDGQLPPPARLSKLCDFARRRVHQGVPLDGMLHAFRTGGIVFWRTMLDAAREDPAIQDEVLFRISEYMFLYVDLVSRTTADAYLEEASKLTRSRDRAKFELSSLVFREDATRAEFEASAATLGFDPTASFCALALRLVEPAGQVESSAPDHGELAHRAAAVLGMATGELLDAIRHGHVILWTPARGADAGAWERETLPAAAERLKSGSAAVAAIGIGSPASGPGGWRASAQQALRAIDIGRRIAPERGVYRYADIAPYDVAARTPEVANFLRSVVERLAGEPDLLKSAAEYFAQGRHLKRSAAALHVHPNTLTYRLHRIEEMLGGTLEDPEWSLRLQLALKLRELEARP